MERKIVIGLIVSTEYLNKVKNIWDSKYIESSAAKLLCEWCWEFYEKYNKAPQRKIEDIFFKKLTKKAIKKDLAEEIEIEILPELSKEFELIEQEGGFDADYLFTETIDYFEERQLTIMSENILDLIAKNEVKKAKELYDNFKINSGKDESTIDLTSVDALPVLQEAFNTEYQNLITYTGALGDFWNTELVRGAFVGIMAPEKRGKTFLLMELMFKAFEQGRNVAFFQAGDMTAKQQIMRAATYITGKPRKEKNTGIQYLPVTDCIKNQLNICNKKVRECRFGIFEHKDEKEMKEKPPNKKELIEAAKANPKYDRCINCVEFSNNTWGVPFLKKQKVKGILTYKEAKKQYRKKMLHSDNKIKLSTHPSHTLTMAKIRQIIKIWENESGFVPDVILIDYMDLIAPDRSVKEFRHQQNKIWMDGRALSQELDALVITPTQTDALSYEGDTITLKNYSEDKRKYSHVTAMYGLSQDPQGREKGIGVMRINKVLIREDEFHFTQQVCVLQNLAIGKPILESYHYPS